MQWEDIQLTRFDPAESFLGLTSNDGDAEMIGIEATIDWLINDNWDLTFSASWNEAELTEDFAQDTSGSPVDAPDGTDLPFTPDLKYSVSTRYTWDESSYNQPSDQLRLEVQTTLRLIAVNIAVRR